MVSPRTPTVATLTAVRKARDLMDRAYSDPLDLTAIASAAGYSRSHFSRVFAAAYGEAPSHYLSRRRVERAQELLRSVNLTVTEVCHLVGYTSLGSFSSRFTEIVGTPPSQFQRAAHRTAPPPIPGCYVLMALRPHAWRSPATTTRTARAEKHPGGGAV